jgi:hypothetical protein
MHLPCSGQPWLQNHIVLLGCWSEKAHQALPLGHGLTICWQFGQAAGVLCLLQHGVKHIDAVKRW